jgi:hypothetical protein
MNSARSRSFAAGAFFVISAYWFISFLIAPDDPGTGSADTWMFVFALSFFAIGCSVLAQRKRR